MIAAIQFRSKTHVLDRIALEIRGENSNLCGYDGWRENVLLHFIDVRIPVDFLVEMKFSVIKTCSWKHDDY